MACNGVAKRMLSPRYGYPTTTRRLRGKESEAFTRVELLAIIAALAFLGMLALPVLASNATNSRLAQCFNNLRQIGIAYHQWSDEHSQLFPWDIPVNDGGTRGGIAANAFIHFAALSNQLAAATHRILVCPSDSVKRPVESPDAFLSLTTQNNSLSYFAGLHGNIEEPQEILSGDRNLRTTTTLGPLCANVGVPASSLKPGDSSVAWTNAIHGRVGNLLLTDGAVHTVTSEKLREAVSKAEPRPEAATHILIPGNPVAIPEGL